MEETRTGSGLELRVAPNARLLILGGDIPGLVAVTPASAAAATSAHAMPDLGTLGGTQSAAYAIKDNGQIVTSGSNTQGQEPVLLASS